MAIARVGLSQVSCASVVSNRLGFLVTSLLSCPPLLSCHKVYVEIKDYRWVAGKQGYYKIYHSDI